MNHPKKSGIVVCAGAEALAERAADWIIDSCNRAIASRGRCTLALAGGSTPEKAYLLLTQPPHKGAIDWSKTYLFFGDERFVPHDDQRSNYAMVQRSLLARASIPSDHVFPIPVHSTAEACASEYAQTLARFFGSTPGQAPPRFDLILLGMGDDAHTASLFPGKPAVHEQQAWVKASPPGVLPPPVERVTLTFPVLNAAYEVLFLVGGDKKAGPLRDVLESPMDVNLRPAAGVRPREGTLTWLVDEPAARLLSQDSIQTSK